MIQIADLHIHSRYSRATSPRMNTTGLLMAAWRKGIDLIGTGDFTHPQQLKDLRRNLRADGNGFFSPGNLLQQLVRQKLPESLERNVRFVLSCEVSSIFRRNDLTYKVHSCILAADFAAARRLTKKLSDHGNLKADGRPILDLDIRQLLEYCLEDDELIYFPAHAWTPHYSLFGSRSGFQSLQDAFGDLAGEVRLLETGLSSDPRHNRRISQLDHLQLISGSDAHSPETVGREATLLDSVGDWMEFRRVLTTGDGLRGTLEFPSAEGKYHYDGHRNCGVCLNPAETRKLAGRCPHCDRPLTVGVLHRIEDLADRELPWETDPPCRTLIPLQSILCEIRGIASSSSLTIQRELETLLARFGPELEILFTVPVSDLASHDETVAAAIERMRRGMVAVHPGYDGVYGRISLLHDFHDNAGRDVPGQLALF